MGPLFVRQCSVAGITPENDLITIIPLYSWYHSSWDEEPELINELYVQLSAVRIYKIFFGSEKKDLY